ncbi:MAG TPA: hypothetical protein VN651_08475 [Gemmatimonadaceae bacterium]|nr:hypothetical protein [Gemmatimonadaceae bacterium]
MRIVIFGASGMVGQGALRECLLADDVREVVSLVRTPTGVTHSKLREIVHRDFHGFAPIADQLSGLDACFFCLGTSSIGKTEVDYTRVTYDITVAAGTVLATRSPQLTFVFVSGAGTDSSEKRGPMWARVKGRAENAIFAMPFKAAYMFRPALIQPMHGASSRTALYRIPYLLLAPFVPVLRRAFPKYVTTTEQIGRAMLAVARHGAPKRILESEDINEL